MSTISSTSVLSFLTWSRLATVTIGTYWSLSIWEMRYMSLARFSLRDKEEADELSDTSGCSSDMWEVKFYYYLLRQMHSHTCRHIKLQHTPKNIKQLCLGNQKEPTSECEPQVKLLNLSAASVYSCCTLHCFTYATVSQLVLSKGNVTAHSFTFSKYFLILHFITKQHPLVSLSPLWLITVILVLLLLL